MSEKIEISFEYFLDKVCRKVCAGMTSTHEKCLAECINHETGICDYFEAVERLEIEIKKPKTNLEKANEIELLSYFDKNGLLSQRVYPADQVDEKISLLMAYIKELESKK